MPFLASDSAWECIPSARDRVAPGTIFSNDEVVR